MPGEQPQQLVIEQIPPAVSIIPTEGADAPKPAETETASPPDGEKDKSATPDPEAEKRKEQRRFQKRIDRLHQRAAEEKARADLLEKQLAEARPKAPEDPGAPRLEQFDYDPEKYAAAKAEYAKKQALEELSKTQRAQAERESANQLVSSWEEKASDAESKYDDFHEVVGEMKPTNPVSAAIMDAENAGDVAYYLGKHLKEAQRIAALPPLSAVREIGKLEAKLLSEAPKPKQPSKAPAPISALSGTGSAASSTIGPEEDFQVFLKKRNAQLKRK